MDGEEFLNVLWKSLEWSIGQLYLGTGSAIFVTSAEKIPLVAYKISQKEP